jgi:hypothetical protein
MEILKKYRIVFLFVLVLLLLVLIRPLFSGGFANHADQWAKPSFDRKNIISRDQLKTLQGEVLLVELTSPEHPSSQPNGRIKQIPAGDILEKDNYKMIQQHKGPVVLHATDLSLSAKVWMILSQTGKSELYILADSMNYEVLKYKFRPDSIIRPE